MLTFNEQAVRMTRLSVPFGLVFIGLSTLMMPTQVRAQFGASGNITAQFESNSNVFALPSGAEQSAFNGLRRSDTYYAYGAELDADYLWGRQKFFATAHATRYEYDHLSELDHNDYTIDAGMNWVFNSVLDGTLSVVRSHAIVPFQNLLGTEGEVSLLTLSDGLQETFSVNYQLNPNWKTIGSAYYSIGDQTSNGFVTQLKQTSGTAALDYLGIGALTSGVSVSHLTGSYDGFNPLGAANPSFEQSTAAFTADYTHTRTIFGGQLGYSRRSSDSQSNSTSGFAGLLNLKYQLTPKTTFRVHIDRTINSYYLNTGSEIDTNAGAGFSWQSTYKLSANIDYTFTYRDFPGQGNNPVGSTRVDIQENWTMSLNYQPQRWVSIKPYANLLTRRSTFIGGAFDSNIFGVTFTFYRR